MNQTATGDKGMSLTTKVLIGMGAGFLLGVILNALQIQAINTHFVSGFLGMIGRMFVNALSMLVVPLVFFSLICGVAGIGDIRILGRVGGKSFGL
jgi:Na+/H+-dicarboxylate symporter